MSSILSEFKVFNNLDENIKTQVICFHIFDDNLSEDKHAFIVTNDDNVYAIGPNLFGKIGLGHNEPVKEWTIINALCNNRIETFFSDNYLFAKSKENDIFAWGNNLNGTLGRGFRSKRDEFFEPEKIEYFKDKGIIQICSGLKHCMALSANGTVYQWGHTYKKNEPEYSIATPYKLHIPHQVRTIMCNHTCSYAITFDGEVYVWKDNNFMIGVFYGERTMKLLSINSVVQVAGDDASQKYFLKSDGTLFKNCAYSFSPIEMIKFNHKIKDIQSVGLKILCQTDECVYYLTYTNNELVKTSHLNFFDFYLKEYNTTNQTIHITDDGFLKTIKYGENYSDSNFIYSSNGRFDNFKVINELGCGTYGKVSLVERVDNSYIKRYAVKKVYIEGEVDKNEVFREIRLMSLLNNNYVVDLITAWTENLQYLFIQMEYCPSTLKKLIINKPVAFKRNKFECMTGIEFKITLEILREITECLIYLHSFENMNYSMNNTKGLLFMGEKVRTINKSIIHRDIKPDNILITTGMDGRYFKLCDFGLSQFIEAIDDTPDIGTDRYIAPEVSDGIYSNKSDVYSLGIIGGELFEVQQNYQNRYSNTKLEVAMEEVLNMLTQMTNIDFDERCNSNQILQKIEDLINSNELEEISPGEITDEFYKELTNVKLWRKFVGELNYDIFNLELKEITSKINDEQKLDQVKPETVGQDPLKDLISKMNFGRFMNSSGMNKIWTDEMQKLSANITNKKLPISDFPVPFLKMLNGLTKALLKTIYQHFVLDKNGLFYYSKYISETLESNNFNFENARNIIRKNNPNMFYESTGTKSNDNLGLSTNFNKFYIECNTRKNRSSIFEAISILLMNTNEYADIVRMMTFIVYFQLRKELVEYCEQIGENYSTTLLGLLIDDELYLDAKDKFKLDFPEEINCSTLIALHILIERPIFIYDGMIDDNDWVETKEKSYFEKYQSEKKVKMFKNVKDNISRECRGQFRDVFIGQSGAFCVTLANRRRPICLHLNGTHFTAMAGIEGHDPFIPSILVPHQEFRNIFPYNKQQIYYSYERENFNFGVGYFRMCANMISDFLDQYMQDDAVIGYMSDKLPCKLTEMFETIDQDIDLFEHLTKHIFNEVNLDGMKLFHKSIMIALIFKNFKNLFTYLGNPELVMPSNKHMYIKFAPKLSTLLLTFINNYYFHQDNGQIIYDSSEIELFLDSFSFFIDSLRNDIRGKEPVEFNQKLQIQQDNLVNQALMPSFKKIYISAKTTINGSCFYNAISRLLFNSEEQSSTIRLMTFDMFFRLRKEFIEYCDRIGETFSNSLYKISMVNEKTDGFGVKNISLNNWADDPSIIATHIAIERPIFIYGGFIDHREYICQDKEGGFQKTKNPFYGKPYENLNNLSSIELSEQFENYCLGTKTCQSINLITNEPIKRPLCIHFESNHYTALHPRYSLDPFIPKNMIPHYDFIDVFTQTDDIFNSFKSDLDKNPSDQFWYFYHISKKFSTFQFLNSSEQDEPSLDECIQSIFSELGPSTSNNPISSIIDTFSTFSKDINLSKGYVNTILSIANTIPSGKSENEQAKESNEETNETFGDIIFSAVTDIFKSLNVSENNKPDEFDLD